MKKRFLSLCLAFIFVLAALCSCVLHKDAFAFAPDYEAGTLTLTYYIGNDRNVTVPSHHWGMPVRAIKGGSFLSTEYVTNITLPDTVQALLPSAFAYLPKLESVSLPDSLLTIGDRAFEYCESLTSVRIPKNVTRVGERAFAGCSSLEKFEVATENATYCAKDGCLYTKDGKTFVAYALGKDTESFSVQNGTLTIGAYAFEGASLSSLTLPKTIEKICKNAFRGCAFISELIFEGSTSDWYKINLENGWADGSSIMYVRCSDGTISVR